MVEVVAALIWDNGKFMICRRPQNKTCALLWEFVGGKRAVQLKKSDYDKYDPFVGMDSANIRNMLRIFGGDPDGKVRKLMDFTDRGGDVADPWYSRRFDVAYRDILEGCTALLQAVTTDESLA